MTRPDFPPPIDHKLYEDNVGRRLVVMESYNRAVRLGDKNVYFIDGANLFRGQQEELCTSDGVHPNDNGRMFIAKYYEEAVTKLLK